MASVLIGVFDPKMDFSFLMRQSSSFQFATIKVNVKNVMLFPPDKGVILKAKGILGAARKFLELEDNYQ